MGVMVNTRPDLFNAIVSQVGFVDVVQSVADPSIPLAVTEWEEWGNPNERESFEYMRSYSPLDTTRPSVLPMTLLTAGLNDSRVAYWEPAKYAQRLREVNMGPNDVLLKTDMGAGHFSYSDRYAYLKEKSFDFAWLCGALGVKV
jgi:oligopeptidase B